MAVVTVRNLSDETHRALKMRAAAHGRSTEAEIREIFDEAARPKERVQIGSALEALARPLGGADLDTTRDPSTIEPAAFE